MLSSETFTSDLRFTGHAMESSVISTFVLWLVCLLVHVDTKLHEFEC